MSECDVTIEATDDACRASVSAHGRSKFMFVEVSMHLKELFATKELGLSTSLILFSWLLVNRCNTCICREDEQHFIS